MPTVHLIIKGKVQGVFFRASARDQARNIGVTGWVKNTAEGNVEAVVSGEENKVRSFIEWCRKGPDEAVVTNVDIIKSTEEEFKDFKIVRG
jgi:acylphosphatase